MMQIQETKKRTR